MIIGFDIGGTKVLGLLVDPGTGAVAARTRASSVGPGPVVVETLAAMVDDLTSNSDHEPSAVGVGVAGLAHPSGVVRYSPNLPELVEFPLGSALEERLGVPVAMGNDATTGALAEARLGAGRGVDDLVFLALGTGIGTGFVMDGRLVSGANGFAGESGHMVIDVDGPEHLTGRRGPWEYYASGSALGRLGREAAAAGSFDDGIARVGSIESIDGFVVAESFAAGDAQAAVVFDGFCVEVARGAANLVLVLDPQRLVLGGGLATIGEPLRAGVDRALHEQLLGAEHRPRVEVVMAALGADAGALGAALLADDPPS